MTNLKQQAFVSELDHLRHCEAIVDKGKSTFLEVGNALLEIKTGKLWKHADAPDGEAGYASFDDYCQRKHQFTKNYANRLIGGVELVKTMPIGTEINEAQARELRKVPEDQREAVLNWAKEKADGKPVTASGIARAAEEYMEVELEEEDDEEESDAEEEVADAENIVEVQAEAKDWLTEAAGELAEACGNKKMVADFLDGLAEFVADNSEALVVSMLENLSIRLRKGL
jgi:hypothetical protein